MILKDNLITKYYLNKYIKVAVPHHTDIGNFFYHFGTLIDFTDDAFFLLREDGKLETISRNDIVQIIVKGD